MDSLHLTDGFGLVIQIAGIIMIATLSFFTTRTIRRTAVDYWTTAWTCLVVSLAALMASLHIRLLQPYTTPVYFLGEYAFGYMFIAGCRNRSTGALLTRKSLRWLAPAIALSIVLAQLSSVQGDAFIFHSAVMALLFLTAYRALQPARSVRQSTTGFSVMSAALFLLSLDFALYVVSFSIISFNLGNLPLLYLKYSSVNDLILEILLGFGTVMVVMDDSRQQLEAANRELRAARDRLEILARVDPLTEALNRHAFYSLVENRPEPPSDGICGCVVIVDIDDLKPINDSVGHTAGDSVIRAVAGSIRSIIRAGDLLFRWGGDEFLILLFGIAENDARDRIEGLNGKLAMFLIPGVIEPIKITVSFGLAAFDNVSGIEAAIERADADMYTSKQTRKHSGSLDRENSFQF
jgi:diguanylate cyclase (GGDEF)-like protein